jgi:hypothetical protein
MPAQSGAREPSRAGESQASSADNEMSVFITRKRRPSKPLSPRRRVESRPCSRHSCIGLLFPTWLRPPKIEPQPCRQPYRQYRTMQTEIAVKKIFLWGENNRSKLSRLRNKFIQSASVNMNEGAFADIMTEMELALTVATPRSGG